MTSIHRWLPDRILDVAKSTRFVLVDPRDRLTVRPSSALVKALLQRVYDEATSRPQDVVPEVVDAALNLILCAVGGSVQCSIGVRAGQGEGLTPKKLGCVGGCRRRVICLG